MVTGCRNYGRCTDGQSDGVDDTFLKTSGGTDGVEAPLASFQVSRAGRAFVTGPDDFWPIMTDERTGAAAALTTDE